MPFIPGTIRSFCRLAADLYYTRACTGELFALLIAIIPRAMPWARSFWAFSPFLNHFAKLQFFIVEMQANLSKVPAKLFHFISSL